MSSMGRGLGHPARTALGAPTALTALTTPVALAALAVLTAATLGCDPLHGLDDPDAAPTGGPVAPEQLDADLDGRPSPLPDGAPDAAADLGPDADAPRCPGAPDATVDAAEDPGPLMPIDAREPDCARLLERPPIVPLERHPPSVWAPGVCARDDRDPSNYTHADPDGPYALHVIAAGDVADEAPAGAVEVHVRATDRPAVLVLASETALRWVVSADPDARIAGVVTAGPPPQRVSGSPVTAQHVGPGRFCAFGDGWEARHHDGDDTHRVMIAAIRDAFDQHETSFQGCARGLRYTVPYTACPETTPPELPPPPADDAPVLGCEDLADESLRCLLVTFNGLDLIGLDSGRTCPIERIPRDTLDLQPMAWRGATAWRCDVDGLVRHRLDALERDVPQVLCGAVTDDGDGFLARSSIREPRPAVQRFDDAEALLAGRPSAEFAVAAPLYYMAAHDGILYASHFSTDRIERYDTATRQLLAPLMLEGFDARVHGFDVVPGSLLLLTDEALHRFDLTTGEALGAWPLTRDPRAGIACRAGP